MRRLRVVDALVPLWALVLALVMLGPGLGSGFLLVRDMVWVPDLSVRSDLLGLGSGLPRAVPSDAVVAVLDEVVPGALLQKTVLLVAVAAGGVGAARLVGRAAGLGPQLVAVTVYGWNAWLAERLLMGQWPVLVGYAVLPWLLLAAHRWRTSDRLPPVLLVLLPLGSLSAGAGLVSAVAVLAAAAGRGRTPRALVLLLAANAPWLVAGLLHAGTATSDARAAEVFALHGEGPVPGPLAALTLGGIWNSEVVPDSRTGVLGWLTLVVLVGLAVVGARRWWNASPSGERTALVVCWAVGLGAALVTWVAPGAVGWMAAHVPGAGVLRDGARVLALCAPLLAVLVAQGVAVLLERASRSAGVAIGLAGVLLPVALLPDLAWGAARQLEPAHYPPAYAEARAATDTLVGDVLVLPLSSYRAPAWNAARPVLDPVGRYLAPDYVASDVLVVDGVALAGEDPRVTAAARALAAESPEDRAAMLAATGVGAVVVDPTAPGGEEVPEVAGETVLDTADLRVVVLPGVEPREVPTGWSAAMALAWGAFLGLPLAGVATALGTRHSRVRD